MAYTFESVIELLGDKAQLVGGKIIVNHGGKNKVIGHQDNSTGVLVLLPEGVEFLDGLSAPKAASKGKKGPAKPEPEPEPEPEPQTETVAVPDLDLTVDGN